MTEDDFQFAIENTRVVRPPQRRLETFGTSIVTYYLVTEEMDRVAESRVREGKIHAERPEIIAPQYLAKLLLEGFGEQANDFARALGKSAQNVALLKYGFRIRKSEVKAYDISEPLDIATARVLEHVEGINDPLSTVLTGVDDAWEVCLLKFMVDLIRSSAGGNISDFREQGLL